MKKIILLLSVCSLLFATSSCGDHQARMELLKMVSAINKYCPMKYDNATCIGMRVEDDNLVVDYVYDEDVVKLDIIEEKPEMAKRYGGSFLLSQNDEIGNLMVRSGYGYTANYKGSKSKKVSTIHLDNDEIKGLVENPEAKNDILKWEVEITNSMLPQQVDEMTTLTSMDCNDNVVSYNYEIDDERISMSAIADNPDEIKENLKTGLIEEATSRSSSMRPFIKLVCRTNKGLQYVYHGKTTGKEIVFEFTNEELRAITHDVIEEE